jgi:hypothetical protein
MNNFNITVKAKLFATLALAGIVMVAVGVLGCPARRTATAISMRCSRIASSRPAGSARSSRTSASAGEGRGRRHPPGCGGVKSPIGMLAERNGQVQELLRKLEATELTEKERQLVSEFAATATSDRLPAGSAARRAVGTFDKAESALIETRAPTTRS